MNLGLPTKSKTDYSEALSELLKIIPGGNVVLFLGSGFSSDARDIFDEEIPLATSLATAIGELGGFDAENDLRYAADRYLDNNDSMLLIKLLRQTFTIKSVNEHHIKIASTPWRRTYTTNYDLCFEQAAVKSGKIIKAVDISHAPSLYADSDMNNVCVHINGSLNSLNQETLRTSFKLSTASYLSPDSFMSSSWSFPFQRDLDYCSAIVFVGYSMYDIEVEKILHKNEYYYEKTYFITKPVTKERSNYTLSKYGKVLPISTSGFGEALASIPEKCDSTSEELVLASLWRYEISESIVDARDCDVDSFLMRGDIDDCIIDSFHPKTMGSPILIIRSGLIFAREMLNSGSNIVITADFGNGKSVFLRQLRTMLARESFLVYTADFKDSHQHDDLDKLIKNGQKSFLIVDSYEQNIELIKHFAELNPSNIQLILGARTNIHEHFRSDLSGWGLSLNEIPIDELDNEEVDQFIEIMTNVGYWGEKAALSLDKKKKLIVNNHKRQISLILLSLLKAPQMIYRVKILLDDLMKNPKRRDTIFAIALLSINDFPLRCSFISYIAMNDEIYNASLRDDENFNQLFHFSGSNITTKSSLFSLTLISYQFHSTYIVDQLIKIVEILGDTRNDVQERKDLQKKLLRFSNIERLLPEKQRKQNLVRYYEQVKLKVTWLRNDPHFWLQFGMSQITYEEYDKAQCYFDQAYAIAGGRERYNTLQIDTQQARLYILRALKSPDSKDAQSYFIKANKLFLKLPIDIHICRQVERYHDVFKQIYPKFSGEGKTTFHYACRKLLANVNIFIIDNIKTISQTHISQNVKRTLEKILKEITTERKAKN